MSNEPKTLTVDQLKALLSRYPSGTKVFMSHDPEGNGYGTLTVDSFEYRETDETVALYPIAQHIDYDEVFPHALDEDEE